MNTILKRIRLYAVLALLTVTACAGFSSSSENPLEGSRWILVGLGDEAPIEGVEITLEFSEGQLGGNSGCNSYAASFQSAAGTIEMSEITMTLMACLDPEGIMEQEQLYLEYLGKAQTYSMDGDQLAITTSDGISLTYTAQN
jgi:heat shock protein HslJ